MREFTDAVTATAPNLSYNIVQVGGWDDPNELPPPYMPLLEFPGSRLVSFEAVESQCKEMQAKAPANHTIIHATIAERRETRTFYDTHKKGSHSLYSPLEELPSGLSVSSTQRLAGVRLVETVGLDEALAGASIEDVDFLLMDVQGAELEVLRGATETLKKTLAVMAEVEFTQLYEDQPLFGDVCKYMTEQRYFFVHFAHICGNKTILERAETGRMMPQLWSDAVFLPYLDRLSFLPPIEHLKLALFANQVSATDVASAMLHCYDQQMGTSLVPLYIAAIRSA